VNKAFVHGSLFFAIRSDHLFVILLYYTDREQRRGGQPRLFFGFARGGSDRVNSVSLNVPDTYLIRSNNGDI
jgi:hypothetical protein